MKFQIIDSDNDCRLLKTIDGGLQTIDVIR